MRRWGEAVGWMVLPIMLLAGCQDDTDVDLEPERVPEIEEVMEGVSSEGVLARIGTDGADDGPWFDFIRGARVSRSGEVIAVLTQGPPHVSVFRNGELTVQFLAQGDAPGEARGPSSVAISRDERQLAVVDPQTARLSVYSLEGELEGYVRLEERPPLAIEAGCDGGWFVIAPDRRQPLPREVAYLLPESLDGSLTPALVDSTDLTHLIGLGGPAEILDVGDRMAVEYGGSAEPRIAEISCTGELLQKYARPITATIERRRARAEQTGASGLGQASTRIVLGREFAPAGFLYDGDWMVVGGLRIIHPGEGGRETEFLVHRRGELVRRVVVPGALQIWDRKPGVGVLVSTPEPFPQVFLIDDETWWSWLLPAGESD